MSLWLVDETLRLAVKITVRADLQDPLLRQTSRLREGDGDRFTERLGEGLSVAIETALDPDLRPPSSQQIAFAIAISKALQIPLPPEALKFRGAMGSFLDAHSAAFKLRASDMRCR